MPVRIGFIGVGGVAQTHFRALEAVPEAQVVAVCDRRAEAATAAARRIPSAQAFGDHREMLDAGDLDAVYVCLPPGEHRGVEIDLARRGVAVFVEKPVGLDPGWVRETAAAVEAAGVVNAVGYNWRYLDLTDAARQELAGQAVALAVGQWIGGLPGIPWWRVKEQSGGQAVEQTSHVIDLCRYLVGEVETVYAGGVRGQFSDVPGYDIEDASAATLIFRSGAVGCMVSTDLAPRGYHHSGLQLFSRDLVLDIGATRLRISRPARVTEMQSSGNAYLAEARAFVRAVATGDRSGIRCDYRDGMRTLEVTLAINESIATGRAVTVGE